MNRSRNLKLVTNYGWGVSYETGSDIDGAILKVYKHHSLNARGEQIIRPCGGCQLKFASQRGDGYGKRFPDVESAKRWAYEHGYLQEYIGSRDLREARRSRGQAHYIEQRRKAMELIENYGKELSRETA